MSRLNLVSSDTAVAVTAAMEEIDGYAQQFLFCRPYQSTRRSCDNFLPLAAVLRDMVPNHPRGILEHVREQAAAHFRRMKPFNDYLNRALTGFKMPER